MAGKFKVGQQFRKNPLSSSQTTILVHLHFKGDTTRIYENIHSSTAFLNRAFTDLNVVSATVIDKSNDSIKEISNYNL